MISHPTAYLKDNLSCIIPRGEFQCFRTVEGEKSLVMGASGSHLCISLHNGLFLRFASGLLRAFCVVFLSNTNVLNLGH